MGGRFNPPDSFPVVYGTLSRAAAGAEFRKLANNNRIGVEFMLPRHIYRFRFRSAQVVDLRIPSTRNALGLPRSGLSEVHVLDTQLIGELARSLLIEAIAAPSSTGIGDMVAIFPDLISVDMRHVELWEREDQIPSFDNSPDPSPAGMAG